MKALGAVDGLGWEKRTCELLFLIPCMCLLICVRMTYTSAGTTCYSEVSHRSFL